VMTCRRTRTPRSSVTRPTPVTLLPPAPQRFRRPRAEDCDKLTAAGLRPLVVPGGTRYQLPDGTLLQLRWTTVRGGFGGGGVALLLGCPGCSSTARVLRRPPGEGWGCWRCRPVSHPSHRRSGARRGRCKPASWHLERIAAEQKHVAELLGLESWPPEKVLWTHDDLARAPRRRNAPRLSKERREALLLRLDLLESIRYGEALPVVERSLGSDMSEASPLMAIAQQARKLIVSTDWAVRRPSQDPRTLNSRMSTKVPVLGGQLAVSAKRAKTNAFCIE
jgi:hypothetical protein